MIAQVIAFLSTGIGRNNQGDTQQVLDFLTFLDLWFSQMHSRFGALKTSWYWCVPSQMINYGHQLLRLPVLKFSYSLKLCFYCFNSITQLVPQVRSPLNHTFPLNSVFNLKLVMQFKANIMHKGLKSVIQNDFIELYIWMEGDLLNDTNELNGTLPITSY